MIIASSNFRHPLYTTFWTGACYHLIFSAIRADYWPWAVVHNLDHAALVQTVPTVFPTLAVQTLHAK